MKNSIGFKDGLYAIANTLLLYFPMLPLLGFTEGRLGIAAFFYKLSDFCGHIQYSNIADDIVKDLFIRFKTKKIALFDLFEISIGISYLIKNEFIDEDFSLFLEDANEMLINFDPKTIKKADNNSKLVWVGMYVLTTLEKKDPSYDNLINKALDIFENFRNYSQLSPIDVNAVLYFLLNIIHRDIYSDRTSQLLKKIDAELFVKDSKFSYCDYNILYESFSTSENMLRTYLPNFSDHMKVKIENCSAMHVFLQENLHALIFNSNKHTSNLSFDFDVAIKERQLKIIDKNLSINGGLAGIGLALLR